MGGLAPPEVEVISLKRTDTQQKIMKIDPWLQNYASDIRLRMDRHAEVRRALLGDHADLTSFANGYMSFTAPKPAGCTANGRPARTRCT